MRVLLQQGSPFDETMHGELVERVPGAQPPRRREQLVDQCERIGGVGTAASGRRWRVRFHDLLQTCVHGSEEGPEPA